MAMDVRCKSQFERHQQASRSGLVKDPMLTAR